MQIQVMCSLAFRAAYIELVPQFEQASGLKVASQFVGGVDIAKRLRAGEDADIVIMAGNAIDGLIGEGLVAAGSRVDLVRSKIGVAVRAGAPRPDIGSSESLKRALLAANAIAYSSGPSGVYLVKVFERWAIPAGKLRQSAPGKPAGDIVAKGDADIGFQQISELMPVPGIDYVGPIPEDIQHITIFSAGTSARAKQGELAKVLTKFLTSRAVVPVLAKHGLDPA